MSRKKKNIPDSRNSGHKMPKRWPISRMRSSKKIAGDEKVDNIGLMRSFQNHEFNSKTNGKG